jgi:hypothetical protein
VDFWQDVKTFWPAQLDPDQRGVQFNLR